MANSFLLQCLLFLSHSQAVRNESSLLPVQIAGAGSKISQGVFVLLLSH